LTYRRRSSPLHAARAPVGCAYCLAFACAALILSNPVALGAVAVALTGAALGARVARELRRALLLALPLAVAIAVVNALVTRDGLTVIARLGNLPLLGHTDITFEATAYGAILGLKAIVLILAGALYTTAVDPDEVLRLFRRVSFHSALTATLATRMVPVLLRDSRRLADAQRCRPGHPPSRVQLMRAATAGVLDRALDVAAALEVRGYGAARRPPRSRRPYSRQDLGFAVGALGVVALAIAMRAGALVTFSAYPALHVSVAPGGVVASIGLVSCAVAPFADRRGIGPWNQRAAIAPRDDRTGVGP
jgi:energy-coupling factor transport system permease protein